MYLYAIKIEECDGGIAIEGVNIGDKKMATDLERKLAGCLDIGFRLVHEAIIQELKKGTIIEGKHIERFVAAGLKEIGGFNLRDELKKAGYIVDE